MWIVRSGVAPRASSLARRVSLTFSGAEGTRTPNPLLAKQVRYQLRHSPSCRHRVVPEAQTRSDAWAHGSAGLAALWDEL